MTKKIKKINIPLKLSSSVVISVIVQILVSLTLEGQRCFWTSVTYLKTVHTARGVIAFRLFIIYNRNGQKKVITPHSNHSNSLRDTVMSLCHCVYSHSHVWRSVWFVCVCFRNVHLNVSKMNRWLRVLDTLHAHTHTPSCKSPFLLSCMASSKLLLRILLRVLIQSSISLSESAART